MKICEPKTKKQFEKYYDLRWRILRKPWNQPRGSEKDSLEKKSIHIMAVENSIVLGVGRGHFNTTDEAQIRFMAIDEKSVNKGIGSAILKELEKRLKAGGAKYIVLDARKTAVGFYKKHGYHVMKKAHILFGSVPHFTMRKDL